MFERYTDTARRAVVEAQEAARSLRHNYIGTEHLLLGLLETDTAAFRALASFNISKERVQAEIEKLIGLGQTAPSGHIPFTPRAKKAMEQALRECLQLGHSRIGPEHLLLGVSRDAEGVGGKILASYNVTAEQIRKAVVLELANTSVGGRPAPVDRRAVQLTYIATLHQRLATAYADLAKMSNEQPES